MIGLILTIIIGFGIAFISRYSSSSITITIGGYTYFDIPLYVLTVGTYLLGILITLIIEIPQSIATAFQIMGLGHKINVGNNTIGQLQNKIKRQEIEDIKLHERNQAVIASRQTDDNYRQNFIRNFLHRLRLR